MAPATNVTQSWDSERKQRSHLTIVARLLIGVAIIAFLVWKVDLNQIVLAFSRFQPAWLVAAIAVQLAANAIWAWRWSLLLAIFKIRAPFWRLMKAIYLGQFFSNFLPTSIGGDFVRAHWILDKKGRYARSVFIVLMERFVGLISLGYVVMLSLPLLLTQGLVLLDNTTMILLVLVELCAGLMLLHPRALGSFETLLSSSFFNDILLRRLPFLSGVRRKISDVLQGWRAAGRRRWYVFLLSLGVHAAGILFYYSVGRGLQLSMEFWHYVVIVPLTVMTAVLPISFNGLGLREGVLVALTGVLGTGVLPAEAVALGLLCSAISLLVSLPGALFYVAGNRTNGSSRSLLSSQELPGQPLPGQPSAGQTNGSHGQTNKEPHIKVAIHGQFYHWTKEWVQDKVVLDAGCGNGLGAAILAQSAAEVTGIDRDRAILARASASHSLPNAMFQVMDCQTLAFAPHSFDVVVSNALLEYLENVPLFFQEVHRVLKPGGLFICGTKNFLLSLKNPDGTPRYPDHRREYTPDGLTAEMATCFDNVKIYGQQMNSRSQAYIMNPRALRIEDLLVRFNVKQLFPSRLRRWFRKQVTGVELNEVSYRDFTIDEQDAAQALYIIAVASKGESRE